MKSKDTSQSQLMQHHITACQLSGLTVSRYCINQQLKVHQYYYWQKKLQAQQPQQQQCNFIKITPVLPSMPVSIFLANGHQISFATLPPVDYVKQLTQ